MLLLLSTVILHLSFAFQPRHNHHHLSSSFTSSAALGGDGGEVRNEDEMERMDNVRMLQPRITAATTLIETKQQSPNRIKVDEQSLMWTPEGY